EEEGRVGGEPRLVIRAELAGEAVVGVVPEVGRPVSGDVRTRVGAPRLVLRAAGGVLAAVVVRALRQPRGQDVDQSQPEAGASPGQAPRGSRAPPRPPGAGRASDGLLSWKRLKSVSSDNGRRLSASGGGRLEIASSSARPRPKAGPIAGNGCGRQEPKHSVMAGEC